MTELSSVVPGLFPTNIILKKILFPLPALPPNSSALHAIENPTLQALRKYSSLHAVHGSSLLQTKSPSWAMLPRSPVLPHEPVLANGFAPNLPSQNSTQAKEFLKGSGTSHWTFPVIHRYSAPNRPRVGKTSSNEYSKNQVHTRTFTDTLAHKFWTTDSLLNLLLRINSLLLRTLHYNTLRSMKTKLRIAWTMIQSTKSMSDYHRSGHRSQNNYSLCFSKLAWWQESVPHYHSHLSSTNARDSIHANLII